MKMFATYRGYESHSYKYNKRYALDIVFGLNVRVRHFFSDIGDKSTNIYSSYDEFFEDWCCVGNAANEHSKHIEAMEVEQ